MRGYGPHGRLTRDQKMRRERSLQPKLGRNHWADAHARRYSRWHGGRHPQRHRGRASSSLVGCRCLTLHSRRRPETARRRVIPPRTGRPFRSSRPERTVAMNTEQTISTFIEYFRERGHQRITGSSLLPPPGDPVLFTTSGMHPLTPYLEGRPHPLGRRLVNLQRCLRTTDLDEVGDHTHLTVFEMLGSWSLGDYGGPQSLRWGYELLRDGFGIDHDRLYVTVFGGDDQVGPDTESLETWQELGVPVELTREENWWSNGPTGPCGPDSEIFVWTGDPPPQGTPGTDRRWVEVWNHVMMRYRRHDDGSLQPLSQSNVDTGMGLERMLTVLQNKPSVFECDVFEPWVPTIRELWHLDGPSLHLVCDHLRSRRFLSEEDYRYLHETHGLPRELVVSLLSEHG